MALSQKDLELLANNPSRGINQIINEIENNWFNGTVQLNSKSHPFVLSMDLILGTSHGFINRLQDGVSRNHLRHARNISELSLNMSDEERYGLFAYPSNTVLQLAMDVNTFNTLSIDRTEQVGAVSVTYKELLVPKDTVVPVMGYDFSIMNGIRIQYNERNGWRVMYDGDTNNPLAPISSNLLDRDFKQVDDRKYLLVNIPVLQLGCMANENITANEASGCRGTYTYNDYLFGVRAFLINDKGMNEIRVSYDQDVFDPLTVTMALDIDTVNNRISYEIPDVYISNGLGKGVVRLYTYTTKGELSKDLTSVEPGKIVPNYQDYTYGQGNLGVYSIPFRNAGGVAWRVLEMVRGGTNPTPFNEIKRRVIFGRQQRTLPITENNLKGLVENYGYSPVKAIDFVTKRTYALTKELPVQGNKGFYSPMACYVGSYLASVDDLVKTGVVLDNGSRVTIPHNVLFDISNPTSRLVNQLTKNQYMNLSGEQLVDLLNRITLVYTPFYYVIDTSDKQAVLRTYHLDSPKIDRQTFVQSNPSLGLGVGVGQIAIEHRDGGYTITLVTQSDGAYQQLDNSQLGVQLSIQPQDTNSLASIPGRLVGMLDKERVWEFQLDSRFDVDVNDVLYFTNFWQFGSVQRSTGSTLSSEITFIFTTAGDKDVTRSDIDQKIDDSIFAIPMVGITETHYHVLFGRLLGNLYSRIRPLVGEAQYKRYDADVPARWLTTTHVRENGQLVFDEAGQPIVEHLAGDIIYEPDGSPRLLYRRDVDIVYENGEPVMLEPRFLKYHWDFIAFDGNYMFSKDAYDKEFAQDTKNFFTDVVSVQMDGFTSQALDRTNLYYQPRSKLGYQRVVINSNYESILRQDLSFTVTYYLTESGYRNPNLRAALESSTPRQLNMALFGKTTIGITGFVELLMKDAGDQVVTVKISALSGDDTVDVISNVDDLTGFSVRKRLELSSDGLVSVQEDIDIIFLPHDVRMASII